MCHLLLLKRWNCVTLKAFTFVHFKNTEMEFSNIFQYFPREERTLNPLFITLEHNIFLPGSTEFHFKNEHILAKFLH